MPLPRVDVDLDYLNRKDWWSKVDKGNPDDCWCWKQSVASHGYGQTWDGKHVLVAHRVAWSLHHSQQVPEGLTVDHICRNRLCCNPNHLRLLSNQDNATDNGQGRKTLCPAGHRYDGDNLYVDPKGHRRCRQCARDRRTQKTL